MKKIRNSEFRIMNFIAILLSFLILNSIFLILPIRAAEPTSIATSSPDLKAKLKALQDEVASRAAKLKSEVTKELQNKAYVGVIKSVSKDAITIATDKGTRLININDYTQYVNLVKSTGKSKSSKDLVVDDYIVALGDVDETSVLTAKKIIKFTAPKEEERKTVFGEITSLEDSTLTITTKENQSITINVGTGTLFKTAKSQTASFADVKQNKPIIVAGVSPKSGVIDAEFIYILPYTSNFKPNTATPSAKVATPSATPKVSGSKSKTNTTRN